MGHVIPSFQRMHLATLIRRCIRMKIVCARRVNFDFVQEFPIRQPPVKDSLGYGASADIAHADKKNSVFEIDHFLNWLKSLFNKHNIG